MTATPQVKKCVICGKEFTTSRRRQICCSPDCTRRNSINSTYENYKKKLKPEVEKVCAICGKEFKTRYSGKKYCSKICRNVNCNIARRKPRVEKQERKKHAEKPNLLPKTCLNCKKVFVGNSPRQIYCSATCRQAYTTTITEKPKYKNDRKVSTNFKLTKAQIEQRERLKEELLRRRIEREMQYDLLYENYWSDEV